MSLLLGSTLRVLLLSAPLAACGSGSADSPSRHLGTEPAASPGHALIHVGENVRIGGDAGARPRVEPYIAASPSDPNRLASTVMVIEEAGRWRVDFWYSEDGGAGWTPSRLPGQEGYDIAGDPWLTWMPDGALYLSHIGIASRGSASRPDWRVLVHRSVDGGRTWERRSEVPDAGGFDHPVLFAGAGGDDAVPLYLAAVVNSRLVLVRSDDGGASFEAKERLSPERGNVHLGAAAAPAPGVVALSYANLQGSGVGVAMRVGVVVSQDGGRTWSPPVPLGEGVFTGQPMMAADPASGRMYVVWAAAAEGGGQDVHLSTSGDSGRSWSAPVRVNGRTSSAVVRMRPSVAVNRDGVVGVSWHDRRHDSGAGCSDTYFAASGDGGRTFLPEARVSGETSCAGVPGNVVGGLDVAKRWPQGGDYSGIAAGADGAFHVIWSDSRTGLYEAWTARVTVGR